MKTIHAFFHSLHQLFGSVLVLLTLGWALVVSAADPPVSADGPLRILCFGAHPDDAELQAGGVGAMWAAKGHKVKFVSLTNGDIGHWNMAGGPLARRRTAEVQAAAKILGIQVEVLDIHDGELMPTLENRFQVIRLIRQWNADIVMSHRPNDYHPDHRYTGVLVQDAAYMVAVPFICPDIPPLQKNPVFLFYPDRFQRPNPFTADIVVSIDSVLEKKLDALAVMESQWLEGGALGSAKLLPKTPAERAQRQKQVRDQHRARYLSHANRFRNGLVKWYGAEQAQKIQTAEAFEICEYGRQPDEKEIRRLFPFFD